MTRAVPTMVLAAVLAAAAPAAPAGAAEPGAVVPFFKAPDLDGRPVALGELVRGRRVAVLFWDWRRATSVRAIQAVDRLVAAHARQGLVALAVEGEGSTAEQVRERVEKLRAIGVVLRSTVVPDPGGRIGRQFGVRGTPEIFLLDGAGRVALHLEGFRTEDEAALEQRVKEALGLAEPPPRVGAEPGRAAVGDETGPAAAPEAAPPPDPRAALLEKYRYFGNYSLNRGEPAKAEEYFRKYVELAPDDADGWLLVGEACVRQRRYDEAREAWEQVLRIAPGHPEADANIRRLIRGEY